MNTNQTDQTPPNIPLCLAYEDAKNEMFSAINGIMQKHKMPLFLYEQIIAEALRQIQGGAKNERKTTEEAYNKQLAEYKKQETGG